MRSLPPRRLPPATWLERFAHFDGAEWHVVYRTPGANAVTSLCAGLLTRAEAERLAADMTAEARQEAELLTREHTPVPSNQRKTVHGFYTDDDAG